MPEYIELKAAKEAVHRIMEPWPNLEEDIYDLLDEIPSADVVEQKRGKWIGGNGVDYVRCGCCHKDYDWVSQAQYYNFCPNCGADMREES